MGHLLTWIPAALGALVALGAAGVSAALVRQSWPKAVRVQLADISERVQAAEAIVESLSGKWAAKVVELEALAEQIEELHESVERKRRRTAAAASKLNGQAPAEGSPEAMDELRARARAMGYRV